MTLSVRHNDNYCRPIQATDLEKMRVMFGYLETLSGQGGATFSAGASGWVWGYNENWDMAQSQILDLAHEVMSSVVKHNSNSFYSRTIRRGANVHMTGAEANVQLNVAYHKCLVFPMKNLCSPVMESLRGQVAR